MKRLYYVIIPRSRVKEFAGKKISTRDAAHRAEIIESFSEDSLRPRYGLRRIDKIVRTPAPVGHGEGHGSTRRRYCVAHCSQCGLHFTSNAAFDEHAISEKHKHPSKSERLVAVEGVDTGCYCMATHYDDPITKYLPFYNQSFRHVPGVRLWEHIKAQKVRDYFADQN